MKSASLPILAEPAARPAPALQLNPFLHVGDDRVYNPLTDRTLLRGEPGYEPLRGLLSGTLALDRLTADDRGRLATEGLLMPGDAEPGRAFRLKYVSLEAHTVCNQSCYFCPVSIAPREDYFMPTELYERIVGELAAYRDTIEAVFMINYNEPTADKRFVDQVRAIKAAGLPPAVLTNGSGLTPDRVDALVEMGGLRFLSINLSTLDRERYRRDRGGDHLQLVLRNLAHARDKPLAETMDMAVLGTGDADHKRDFEEISAALRRQPFRRQVLRGDGPRRLSADRPPAGLPRSGASAAARTSARAPCSTSTSPPRGSACSAARTTTASTWWAISPASRSTRCSPGLPWP